MVGDLGDRQTELRRELSVAGTVRVALGDEIVPAKQREANLTRCPGRLRPEALDRLSEQAAHPLTIEPIVGVGILPEGAGELELALRASRVDRHDGRGPAALEAPLIAAGVGGEPVGARPKVGSELGPTGS